jgi:hypothetical protein
MRRRRDGQNLALSFLDVLANALGAVVLLFVAFAALQAPQAEGSRSTRPFIRFEWTVADDPGALMRVRLVAPSGASGRVYYVDPDVGPRGGTPLCALPGTQSHALLGFDVAWSPTAAYGATRDPTRSLRDRTFVLRLHEPVAGEWKADAIYFDRADGVSFLPGRLRVRTLVATNPTGNVDWSGTGRQGPDEQATVNFGGTIIGPRVMVQTSSVPTLSSDIVLPTCPVDDLK